MMHNGHNPSPTGVKSQPDDQDSDDGQLLSGDEHDHDLDDLDVVRLGKRKRPISVS